MWLPVKVNHLKTQTCFLELYVEHGWKANAVSLPLLLMIAVKHVNTDVSISAGMLQKKQISEKFAVLMKLDFKKPSLFFLKGKLQAFQWLEERS